MCAVALITTTVQEGHTKNCDIKLGARRSFYNHNCSWNSIPGQPELAKATGYQLNNAGWSCICTDGGGGDAETKIVGHCNLKRWTTEPPFQTRHALSKNKMSLSPPFSALHLDCVAT